ncbi:WhiB family transcriptional regulator [Streptomyces chartreusis]|uniref:WhiB family transcriptional regulator n=1 Tax=Streptomyces chartreusis TaxID=1969 RepID=UPI0033EC8CC3
MSHYSGSIPDTLTRPNGWAERAACQGLNDVMFPDKDNRGIAAAKAICRTCPVWEECLRDALETGDNLWGVRGGLTDRERRDLAHRYASTPVELPKPRNPRRPRPTTLADAVRQRTVRTKTGHLAWNGVAHLRFQGKRYTAFQAAFIVGHGREPVGTVRRTCGEECFRADHLVDTALRDEAAKCGTTAGFWRHHRLGEQACGPCRRARAGKWHGAAVKAVAV